MTSLLLVLKHKDNVVFHTILRQLVTIPVDLS